MAWVTAFNGASTMAQTDIHPLEPVPLEAVHVQDAFWSPKLGIWQDVTVHDALDKFEQAGAFRNFDRVAKGLRENHEGPPWFDGLIYETIRAASDFLLARPDPALEKRLDAYIERIAAAQQGSDGYLLTYTQLDEPGHRWGLNGGYQLWQHELYNAGALVEAGTHHYRATGKTQLLEVAARFANLMCDLIGPSPKMSIVPSHSLPEEAMTELYILFRHCPALKNELPVPVKETRYLRLVEYWLDNRGNNCGKPTSEQWHTAEPECAQWIRKQAYLGQGRPSWGDYAQDHLPIFEQKTIEGHAVRATLMCAGLSATARINGKQTYAEAAAQLWDNMVGQRMHITGGVGAFSHQEKFGPDYCLPNNAYLETCAAVGAGFFHRNMNLLFGHAKYADELERVLYNNVLNGVSLAGNRYYYQNPLTTAGRSRWAWHGCPCCPPMFLKIVSAVPGYIYATDNDGLYVNLFIGSEAKMRVGTTAVTLAQTTDYPWDGRISVTVTPAEPAEFTVFMRVPGWARGVENPFGLYRSDRGKPRLVLRVNGEVLNSRDLIRGYAAIKRIWANGDKITMELPMAVRRVYAHPAVEADAGRVALASGPLVYCLEEVDNPQQVSYFLQADSTLSAVRQPELLGSVTVIEGSAWSRQDQDQAKPVQLTAIPFYCQDNRTPNARIDVWIAEEESVAIAAGPALAFRASASHSFDQDTVKAMNDGVAPACSNDHTIPRHTWWNHKGSTEWAQYDFDRPRRVSSVALYWWDDRPAGGGCAVPRSWRLLYEDNGQWRTVKENSDYGIEKDRFNEVSFDAVDTTSLRIEVQLQDAYSGGVLEWKVR